ncbi:NADH:flavin oxidoreductase/NADH oxidase [Agrobacterium tumefaciens]|uniref:NADH:flavin oxidoreductase/NADH oxidase n=1 Tax=Agrobacterium tumefaciens TaxID=358 RepID=UPI0012B99FD8|nr:NADH:flavin oxidoreductase/NADH oxidase [Agrobacterium tumefaciens]MQB07910.1 NADH:flavin oxidoreductase/NADH oxidase [Agrobacterium tumefaciens]
MAKIFDPLTIRGVALRNRLAVSPMCQYQAVDGVTSDFHLIHYGKFALGGFGLVMVEATGVSPEGRITHGDVGIWDDAHVEGLARIAASVKQNGAIPGIQIGHAGAKASLLRPWHGNSPVPEVPLVEGEERWPIVSASTIPMGEGWPVPVALDADGLAKVRNDFANAACRALKAGFDVLEIHCAHGFLLNSFLSPLTNKRTDDYGGSIDNRMRLPLEIAQELRTIWPQDKPLFVRISAVDGSRMGWTIEDSVTFAKELAEIGVDVVDCSSGGFGVFDYPSGYGFQVPFAARVREGARIKSMAVGLIVDPLQAEAILENGEADLVAIGHEALRNPHFAVQAEQVLGAADPQSPFSSLAPQYGWWLNGRKQRLDRLGPLSLERDAAA